MGSGTNKKPRGRGKRYRTFAGDDEISPAEQLNKRDPYSVGPRYANSLDAGWAKDEDLAARENGGHDDGRDDGVQATGGVGGNRRTIPPVEPPAKQPVKPPVKSSIMQSIGQPAEQNATGNCPECDAAANSTNTKRPVKRLAADKSPSGFIYQDASDESWDAQRRHASGEHSPSSVKRHAEPHDAGGGSSIGSNIHVTWIFLGLVVLGIGGAAWWVATEGIPMATNAVEDAAGLATDVADDISKTIDSVTPEVDKAVGITVDTVSDTMRRIVEDSDYIADAIVSLLPEAVGPYTLHVGEDVPDAPPSATTTQPPGQPPTTTSPPTSAPPPDKPQSPLDRTIWPDDTGVVPPSSSSQSPSQPDTKSAFIEQVEDHVHRMTNDERTSRGIYHLADDSRLDGIARGHSQDMAARNYFDHDTPEERDPTDRGMAVGYDCTKDYGSYYTYGLAENIFTISRGGSNAEALARQIVDSWMNSPGHRQNILELDYDRLGVGIAVSRTGAVYATQNFC